MNMTGAEQASSVTGKERWKNLRAVFVRRRVILVQKKQCYLTDVLPFVKTGTPLQASNLPERNTEETETVGEPTLQEDTGKASTKASDYQPKNPLYQTEQTNIEATEINPVSAEVPQPKCSSTSHIRPNKRKRPLDEVDKLL